MSAILRSLFVLAIASLDKSFFSRPQTTRADCLVQGIGQNPHLPTHFGQMAIKVVHLSIPLLKGDLRIDVRDSCRKDRQLYLWHAAIVATFGQKKQPSSPSSTRAKPSHLSSSSCLSARRE